MKLLLDTHILIWGFLEPESLTPAVRDELERPSNELWYSPISVWETILLSEKGRIELKSDPADWIRKALRKAAVKEAPLNLETAVQSRKIKLVHNDPADRFIAATAQVYELVLVTADKRLKSSDEYSVLFNG